MEQRCPACAVTMERMSLQGYNNLTLIDDDPAEGVAGSLGMKQRHDVDPLVCPECGLVRLYADLDGDAEGGGGGMAALFGGGLF